MVRESVWEWFNGTVYNRLQPGGAIILINHRMHEDDLAGRLIERMKAGADTWTIVRLPAIAEAPSEQYPEPDPLGRKVGEALWPASYPVAALDRIRANTTRPAIGMPSISSGQRRTKARCSSRPSPAPPPQRRHLRLGARMGFGRLEVDGDWTAGVLMGKTRTGQVVIGNVVRFRGRPNEVANKVLETARGDVKGRDHDPDRSRSGWAGAEGLLPRPAEWISLGLLARERRQADASRALSRCR